MQDLYTIDETTKTAANVTTWIQPGIREDLKIVEVKYGISKNGKEFLAFCAENNQADKVSCTEWQYNPKIPFESQDAVDKEKTISIIGNQMSKVKQIVETFFTDAELKARPYKIQSASFKEFAEKTVAFLGDTFKNKSVRLKVVFDNRGWTTFGQSAKAPFIESMDIPKEKTRLRILPSDKMVRPAQPEDDSKEKLPSDVIDVPNTAGAAQGAITEDDLPF